MTRLLGCFTLPLAMAGMPLAGSDWTAGGSDVNWSTPGNWSAPPDDQEIFFGIAGAGSNPLVATNHVDGSLEVRSLTYQYHSATLSQVTGIAAGATLTVGGGASSNVFTVGGLTGNAQLTSAVFHGNGTLNISQNGGIVMIGNHYLGDIPTNTAGASLDMRGLQTFIADLGATGEFNAGSSLATIAPGAHQITNATVYLAKESRITAGALRVGAVVPNSAISIGYVPSKFYLGGDTVLNVDAIHVGRGYTSKAVGEMAFDPAALSGNAKVTIRGADGEGAVGIVNIGVNDGTATSNRQEGAVDFSGGEVDALIDTLIVGSGASSSSTSANARATGMLTMDKGTITTATAIVGRSTAGAGIGVNEGTVNVNGGRFEVGSLTLAQRTHSSGAQPVSGILNIRGAGEVVATNGIVMGQRTAGSSTSALTAEVNVEGGSLTAGGDIARGSGTNAIDATLRLRGGVLDLGGHNIDVNTFVLEEGGLRDVNEINGGGAVTKTGTGVLTLEGTHAYSGATDITAGTLRVSGHVANSDVTIRSGATLHGAGGKLGGETLLESGSAMMFELRSGVDYDALEVGLLTLESGVDLQLTLDFAPVTNESFTLLSGSYAGAFASINGEAFDPGNLLELSYGGTSYQFQLSYEGDKISLQAIPEPRALALLGLVGAAFFARRRRA